MELAEKLRMEEAITIQSDEQLKMHYRAVLDKLLSDPELHHDEVLKLGQEFMEFEIIIRWMKSIK